MERETDEVGRRAYRLMSWWWVGALICVGILIDGMVSDEPLRIPALIGVGVFGLIGYLRG